MKHGLTGRQASPQVIVAGGKAGRIVRGRGSFRLHMRVAASLVALFAVAGPAVSAPEGSAEEKGLAIALEVDRRDAGFRDQNADMTMVLTNRENQESRRELRIRILEIADDGDKLLIVFDEPADVKGTAFLSYTHASTPDEQWLYLPALKRTKRIASANKSGPFVGSEFAYEDVASNEVKKYTYKYQGSEIVAGREAFVIERYPAYDHSGYTRQREWVDKSRLIPLKIEYYDRKGELLKTLAYEGYRQYLDKHWRADQMHMRNHQTGRATTMIWRNYRFRTGLTERDFDKSSLQRAR